VTAGVTALQECNGSTGPVPFVSIYIISDVKMPFFLIKFVKELKPTTLVILGVLCLIVVCLKYSWPLAYHYINKKLHDDLTESVIRRGDVEAINKWAHNAYDMVEREEPPEKKDTLRYVKLDVVTSTLLSATSAEPDSILIKNRDEKLNTLISLDPNSAIIPHTQDFIRRYGQRQIDPNQFRIYDNTPLDDPDGTTQSKP